MPTVIPDPLRLHIIKTMCEGFRTITPVNGYVLDFSGAEGTKQNRVFRGRAVFGARDPIPALSVLEAPIPLDQLPSPHGATESAGPWELVVQGFFEDDKDNPCDQAYVGLADVKKYLALEKEKTQSEFHDGGLFGIDRAVTGMIIGQGVVRPPDEISAKAYFWLTLALEVAEDLKRPYEV